MRISDWSSDVCSSDLMARLGYSRYGVQGGDWGGIIGRRIAQRHSGAVAALHTNIPYAYPPKGAAPPESYKEFRKTGTADRKSDVSGKRVSVSVELGGRRSIKKKQKQTHNTTKKENNK